jgi:hypothetical protein
MLSPPTPPQVFAPTRPHTSFHSVPALVESADW